MAGITSLEHAAGMKPAYPSALAKVRNEALAPLDGTDSTTPEFVIGASEYADYKQELDRLRAIRARELPDRMRQARGFVSADAAEEIAHIQGDDAVVEARIARLEDLLRSATVLPDGPANGIATLGCTVEVEYERTGRRGSYRLSGIASGTDARSVSARSPVGRAVMGRRTGDVVSVELPSGRAEALRIVAITPPMDVEAA
jgi:transcription elongation factor GreA